MRMNQALKGRHRFLADYAKACVALSGLNLNSILKPRVPEPAVRAPPPWALLRRACSATVDVESRWRGTKGAAIDHFRDAARSSSGTIPGCPLASGRGFACHAGGLGPCDLERKSWRDRSGRLSLSCSGAASVLDGPGIQGPGRSDATTGALLPGVRFAAGCRPGPERPEIALSMLLALRHALVCSALDVHQLRFDCGPLLFRLRGECERD